jgi:hypothetical protein
VVAPYYNLIIHRIEIFASMLRHGKNYSQKTEVYFEGKTLLYPETKL